MSETDNLPNAEGEKDLKKETVTTKEKIEVVAENANKIKPSDSESIEVTDEETKTPLENTEIGSEIETIKESNVKTEETEAKNEPENEANDESETSNNEEPSETENSNGQEDDDEDDFEEDDETEEEDEDDSHEDDDDGLNKIEKSNAEDAEDEGNKDRHKIEVKEYDKMSLEALAIELERLLKNEKIQAIRSHVSKIRKEFKSQFESLVEDKKAEFINDGGHEIDFYYSSPVQKRFKTAYKEYRTKLNEHYKNLEKNLKENLEKKLEIIEELKGLINVEENINTTYNHFKELQERWRNTGPIPRDKYNNAWNSYHHHVEIFYDFLHLNRELRDLDFKHNLDKKLKIIEHAEELAKSDNVMHAFRELQELHKMWKEELGPVAKEHREEIWERFKAATKTINQKRQLYYKDIEKTYEKNLEVKEEIIANIQAIAEEDIKSHGGWQKKIKEVEALRTQFFNAGKVPIKVNEATWKKFKDAVRSFNRQKNSFYKGLKKEQYTNLEKKLELIKIAEDNKDSEDLEATTPLMKKIQSDWKKIGHVPRKDSDKIWKRFKKACNAYFDRIHADRNKAQKAELETFNKKQQFLNDLKDLKLSGKKAEDLKTIKDQISAWKDMGRVPYDKRYIEGKFYKTIDSLFSKLDMDQREVEMVKFENKLEELNSDDNSRNLDNERSFISKKIDEVKGQINQLENNLQFFTNVDDDNPLVQDVHKNIKKHKQELDLWETKLSKIKELY